MNFDPAVGYANTDPVTLPSELNDAGLELGPDVQKYPEFVAQQGQIHQSIQRNIAAIDTAKARLAALNDKGRSRTDSDNKEMKGLLAHAAWLEQDALKQALQWQNVAMDRGNQMVAQIQYAISDTRAAISNLDIEIAQHPSETVEERAALTQLRALSQNYRNKISVLGRRREALLKIVAKYEIQNDQLKEGLANAQDLVAEHKKRLVKILDAKLKNPPQGATERDIQEWTSSLRSLQAQLAEDAKRDGEAGWFAWAGRKINRFFGGLFGTDRTVANYKFDPYGLLGAHQPTMADMQNLLTPEDVKRGFGFLSQRVKPLMPGLEGLDANLASGTFIIDQASGRVAQNAQEKWQWIEDQKVELERKKAQLPALEEELNAQIAELENAYRTESAGDREKWDRLAVATEAINQIYASSSTDRERLYDGLEGRGLLSEEIKQVRDQTAQGKIPTYGDVLQANESLGENTKRSP